MDKIFTPNLTSKLLLKSASELLSKKPIDNYIELGCGSGFITFNLTNYLSKSKSVFLTDISNHSIDEVKKVIMNEKLNFTALQSNLFDNVDNNLKFDLILSDVAAISEKLLPITDWYNGVSCKTGNDGLALISSLLKSSSSYMRKNSVILYPALSLSNMSKLRTIANAYFENTSVVASKDWPYKFENNDIDYLNNLKEEGMISFKLISGFHVFTTEIWKSWGPID